MPSGTNGLRARLPALEAERLKASRRDSDGEADLTRGVATLTPLFGRQRSGSLNAWKGEPPPLREFRATRPSGFEPETFGSVARFLTRPLQTGSARLRLLERSQLRR